jgi:hypothetical protein
MGDSSNPYVLIIHLCEKIPNRGMCGIKKMERETRLELATSTLARWRSTTELFPLNCKKYKIITTENQEKFIDRSSACISCLSRRDRVRFSLFS